VEERERGTLQYLLTTCLGDGEIVAGKLIARTAFLLLILLTGIPILALLQLLGGVDLAYLVVCLVLTCCNVFTVASLCLWLSTWTRRPVHGIGLGYLVMFGYHVLFAALGTPQATFDTLRGDHVGAALAQMGNFFGALGALQNIALDGSLGHSLPMLLSVYIGVHAALTGLFLFLTRLRLRELIFPKPAPVDLTEDDLDEKRELDHRPRLENLQPILWKDLYSSRSVLANLNGWHLGLIGVYSGVPLGAFTMAYGLALSPGSTSYCWSSSELWWSTSTFRWSSTP